MMPKWLQWLQLYFKPLNGRGNLFFQIPVLVTFFHTTNHPQNFNFAYKPAVWAGLNKNSSSLLYVASVGADKLGLGESVSRRLTHVADKLVLELAGNLVPLHTELLGLPKSMAPGIQGHKAGMRDCLMIWSQESHSITSFVLCWLHGHKRAARIQGNGPQSLSLMCPKVTSMKSWWDGSYHCHHLGNMIGHNPQQMSLLSLSQPGGTCPALNW